MEWIASEAHGVGTNHLTQSKNKKEVLCGVYRRRERSNTPNRSYGSQEIELITVSDENFIMTLPPPRAEELIKQYSDVFDRPLGTLRGEVHLEVDSSAKPVIAALKDDLKKEVNRYVGQEILAPVEEPTPWVSSLAVATKKSGALNEALKRETFQIPILDKILPELSQAKVLSTVDLRSGYWHCVRDHESSLLTTFSTPFGSYHWCRLPFGLSVSSEIFQKRVNQALEGLSGVLDIADDILVYGIGNNEQEATADHSLTREISSVYLWTASHSEK